MIFIDRQGERAAAVFDALGGTDYVARLQKAASEILGRKTVAVASKDGALHAALYMCGAGAGDYVFVPSYTFYSYIAPVGGVGAIPVFLDCDPITRCVSAEALEQAFVWAELQRKMPKAVIIDNAFGSVADYNVLTPLCKAYGVPTIELCSGLCGEYNGKPCGGNCDYGAIGLDGYCGILVCDDEQKALGFCRYAYTDGVSFDYRLNNFSASAAYAYIPLERKISARGKSNLAALCAAKDNVVPPVAGDSGKYALAMTDNAAGLSAAGFDIKTPPPVHTLPKYGDCAYFEHETGYSVCDLFCRGVLIGTDYSPLKRAKIARLVK